ncbi:hypothetical protein [Desulfobacter postgatei]|uniref:Uncharacterized protein n=1 Tax=Desulfobacter postgatei 2ac9 TaxID=879212 RepID=I5B2T1_9BACT|nr:hypothetical protein [Desulfobacter postgatei]EIM63794.1 hypothetical protein DespoDRAFT_01884 [Desulfobacter postgatei 2ac9]
MEETQDSPVIETPEHNETQTHAGSPVLANLDHSPKTIYANCPNAVWHITEQDKLRIFCRLMHALIDESLKACDGAMMND